MRHHLLALLPLVHVPLLLAQDLPTKEEVLAQLAHHARVVAGEPGAVAAFTATGTVELGDNRSAVRLFVRRAPFGCRREVEPLQPHGPTVVTITDGRFAWDGGGRPLAEPAALLCFEDAFVDGLLYLDPAHLVGLPDAREVQQPDYPGLPAELPRGMRTHLLALESPAGTVLQAHLDLADQALREVVSILPGVARWTRFGGEQQFGALTVPLVRASGRLGSPDVEVRRWTEVRTAASLPDELFAPRPLPVVPPLQRAGRLEVVAHTQPGSVHFDLPVVTINGRHLVRAKLDVGCSHLCIAPELANALRLPPRSPLDLQGFLGKQAEQPTAWLDSLAIGDRPLLQHVLAVASLGFDNSLPLDRQLGMLVGLTALQDSPVLDFVTGELHCRGAPVVPLAASVAVGRVTTVPLRRADNLLYYVPIEVNGTQVEALLDSGMPATLRLSRAVLQRCGLPVDSASWIAAGGCRMAAGGIGGDRWHDVVAQLDAWKLGDVTFHRPLVILGGLDDDRPQLHDAVVGAGALAAFARVGFDLQRGCLELDPGDRLPASRVVPPAGELLGFCLASPAFGSATHILPLPTITEVAAGSAAAKAGLAPRDRVWSIGGSSCAGLSAGEVNRRFWLAPGEHVQFEVLTRDGTRRQVRLPQ